MNNHLFLFTIGPVQSFIAQARKTQDLWSGSYLLSYLIDETRKHAIEKLEIKPDDFIFPSESNKLDNNIASLPNRLLLQVTSPKNIGNTLEQFVRDLFIEIIKFPFNKLQDEFIKEFGNFEDNIENQANDFLEIYWVAIPFTEENYNRNYRELEFLLGARKNIKNFSYSEEHGVKCPICGERAAIHSQNKFSKKDILWLWKKISARYPIINANETLCPICLAKRFLPNYLNAKNNKTFDFNDIRFPSTSEVSASKFKLDLLENHIFSSFEQKFPKEFNKKGLSGCLLPKNVKSNNEENSTIDGHWLYKENFTKKEFSKYFANTGLSENKFLNIPDRINIGKKSSYYAVIFMDGDNMGKKITQLSFEEHKNFSRILADFSSQIVPYIVEEEFLGKLIYAGGDDLAALINLNDLLPVLEKLRKEFSNFLNSNRFKYPSIKENFTMSAGVCIAHYKAPFSLTLQIAGEMENKAKNIKDASCEQMKNAVAISVMSHSGNNKETVFPWEYENSKKSSTDLMLTLQGLISQDILSKNFIYVLKDEFSRIINKDGKTVNEIKDYKNELVETELKRIIKRKTKKGISREKKDLVDKINIELFSFCKNELNLNLTNFISFLEITNVISREM